MLQDEGGEGYNDIEDEVFVAIRVRVPAWSSAETRLGEMQRF